MSSAMATVDPLKPKYKSQQAPRSQREKTNNNRDEDKENKRELREPLTSLSAGNLPQQQQQQQRRPRGPSLLQNMVTTGSNDQTVIGAGPPPPSPFIRSFPQYTLSTPYIRNLLPAPLQVQCMARTRIPTPHGPAFLHLYRNNKDEKEHLALVVDPTQLEQEQGSEDTVNSNFIRSASLDAKWSEDETELDRLTRGAYIGRLSPTVHRPSKPSQTSSSQSQLHPLPPLVRIHSECFTGETVGSMRCDCGEQLDEALRLISSPPSSSYPGRGAVVYLRQEGRGIGLLSKIRAYNLQDMGHDTVQANLLLGHGADERRYDIAAAILRDLGLEDVELLTNNPDKVKSLEKEGIRVISRRAMVPRSWQQHPHRHEPDELGTDGRDREGYRRIGGATLIGGGAAHGPELEKYLRTKVERMGHMLDMPPSYES